MEDLHTRTDRRPRNWRELPAPDLGVAIYSETDLSPKFASGMSKSIVTIALFPVEPILQLATLHFSTRVFEHDGKKYTIRMDSDRYHVFRTSLNCAQCNLSGAFMALQRTLADPDNAAHFNLYGFDADGIAVLMTKDHIIPKSKGGKNQLANYQTLCTVCNLAKADS